MTSDCFTTMQIRVGYELIYDRPQQTPMVLMLNIHHTRASDIIVPDRMIAEPFVPVTSYRDGLGNWCTRILASTRIRVTVLSTERLDSAVSHQWLANSGSADRIPGVETIMVPL